MCLCVCARACVCEIYIYIYIERERERKRERERERDREGEVCEHVRGIYPLYSTDSTDLSHELPQMHEGRLGPLKTSQPRIRI